MTDLPFHPYIVHVAIGLAVAVAVMAPVLWLCWVKALLARRSWWLVALLQALLLVTAVVSVRSGEVAALDARDWLELERIEHHQDLGEAFTVTAGLTLVLIVVGGLLGDEQRARQLVGAAVVGTTLQLGLGAVAGHAGGELVWGPDGMFERAVQGHPSLRSGE